MQFEKSHSFHKVCEKYSKQLYKYVGNADESQLPNISPKLPWKVVSYLVHSFMTLLTPVVKKMRILSMTVPVRTSNGSRDMARTKVAEKKDKKEIRKKKEKKMNIDKTI